MCSEGPSTNVIHLSPCRGQSSEANRQLVGIYVIAVKLLSNCRLEGITWKGSAAHKHRDMPGFLWPNTVGHPID